MTATSPLSPAKARHRGKATVMHSLGPWSRGLWGVQPLKQLPNIRKSSNLQTVAAPAHHQSNVELWLMVGDPIPWNRTGDHNSRLLGGREHISRFAGGKHSSSFREWDYSSNSKDGTKALAHRKGTQLHAHNGRPELESQEETRGTRLQEGITALSQEKEHTE